MIVPFETVAYANDRSLMVTGSPPWEMTSGGRNKERPGNPSFSEGSAVVCDLLCF